MVDDPHYARGIGETGQINAKMILGFGGHALYCRKCVTGEKTEYGERAIGNILIPETCVPSKEAIGSGISGDRSLWLEVIALGPRVGQPATMTHRRKHPVKLATGQTVPRARCIAVGYSKGDLIKCPNQHPTGIKRSPLCDYEFFIEESVPEAVEVA